MIFVNSISEHFSIVVETHLRTINRYSLSEFIAIQKAAHTEIFNSSLALDALLKPAVKPMTSIPTTLCCAGYALYGV